MRHIFDSNISSQAYDWEDDPFGTDYLMQANNRHATITADDEYEDYINPDTRRRNKTQAPQLFKRVDARAVPIVPGDVHAPGAVQVGIRDL